MNWPLDVFWACLRMVPDALVSEQGRDDLAMLASTVPFAKTVLLEASLGDGATHVDVSFPAFRAPEDARAWRDWADAAGTTSPEWERIWQFSRHWGDASSTLREAVKNIWFEFDVGRGGTAPVPLPAVGLTIRDTRYRDAEVAHALDHALATLMPLAMDRPLSSQLAGLPSEAKVSHLGAPLSRGASHVRVNLRRLTAESAWTWLQAQSSVVATPGIVPKEWEQLWQISDRPIVTVDVGNAVAPRVGVECLCADRETLQRLLSLLDTLGLCAPAKAEVLALWPGHFALTQTAGPSVGQTAHVTRQLNHIKVAFVGGRPVLAKAYLRLSYA